MISPQLFNMAKHGFIYFENGDLYGFGNNSHGQLGIEKTDEYIYKYILTDSNIVKIVVGSDNSYILKRNGQLYGAGNDQAMGWKEIFEEEISEIVCGEVYDCVLKTNGQVWYFNSIISEWYYIDSLTEIKSLYLVDEFLYAYKTNKVLYRIKLNENTQTLEELGVIDNLKGIFKCMKIIFIWHDNSLSMIYDSNNITLKNKTCIYESDDLLYVMANNLYICIINKDHSIYRIQPKPILSPDLLITSIISAQQHIALNLSNYNFDTEIINANISGFYLGHDFLLYMKKTNYYTDVEFEEIVCWENSFNIPIDIPIFNTQLKSCVSLMQSVSTLFKAHSQPIHKLWPQYYDSDQCIRILGAGTYSPLLNINLSDYYPKKTKTRMTYILWTLKQFSCLPKYMKYKIVEFTL